jgi:replicative superfamily II helicase
MALRLVALYHWAKATEILAIYMLQGLPEGNVQSHLNQHFEAAYKAAGGCYDCGMEMLLRWLHAAAKQMVSGSLWWVARSINSRVTRFVESVTSSRALFELLPPQQVALQEQGLLDIASRAVVIDMPTSGGKTLLAQFRILQTLNQFATDGGWVAYVVPTRALAAQITRNLRRDFEPIGIKVEQLTSAIDIDIFEDSLLKKNSDAKMFDVLVATPEKLQLVIRNKKVPRPLRLIVMDEAHNIEDKERGLRIELLLATIKGEFQDQVSFMLLMPYVEQAETLARWLAGDAKSGKTISLSTTPWKPNERIVGLYDIMPVPTVRGGWKLIYETLTTTPKTIHLKGSHSVGSVKPLDVSKSAANNSVQTAAMATIFSGQPKKSTSIAIAQNPNSAWSMARTICKSLPEDRNIPEEIKLVKNFLLTEFGEDYGLIKMLDRRVGVHHSKLSEEVRALMEWLAEKGLLRILCATTTIAQGVNFPVGSVFLASCFVQSTRSSRLMTPREFWNLAGRAGRIGHDSVGVVGIAAGDKQKIIRKLVSGATGALISRIVQLLEDLESFGNLNNLSSVIYSHDWEDFRCYVTHLLNEKKNLDTVIAEMDRQLRNTFGFGTLQADPSSKRKAEALLSVTKEYVSRIGTNMGMVALADSTGFSYEGVARASKGINELTRKLTSTDWIPSSLFGKAGNLSNLVGIMFKIDQIAEPLKEIKGEGLDHLKVANITKDWVNGKRMDEIAKTYFSEGNSDATKAMDEACKAIYRAVVISGTWGVSALSKIGVNFDDDKISDEERRQINSLPAMMYHGVRTEEAVLMRMNQVPRSIAESLGKSFRTEMGTKWDEANVQDARQYLQELKDEVWDKHIPKKAKLSGSEYRDIWKILSGEAW